MRSVKHCALFYTLSGAAASIYALIRVLVPYSQFFTFLFASFAGFTLFFLWTGPRQFLVASQKKRYDEPSSTWWSYLLITGYYLVSAGTFAELLCRLGGNGGWNNQHNADMVTVIRVWLFQQALAFIIIGILEPMRKNRVDIQPSLTETFPRIPNPSFRASWFLLSWYSMFFVLAIVYGFALLSNVGLGMVCGSHVLVSDIFYICSSSIDRFLVVPVIALGLIDLFETIFYLVHRSIFPRLLRFDPDITLFHPGEEGLLWLKGIPMVPMVTMWFQITAWI